MQPTQPMNRPLALFSLGGLVALIALLRIPSDADSAWLMGYSRGRLLLAAGMFSGVLLSALAAFRPVRLPPAWRKRFENRQTLSAVLALTLLVLGADFLYAALLWRRLAAPLAVRLSPLIGWTAWGAALLLHHLLHTTGYAGTHQQDENQPGGSSWTAGVKPVLWAWGALGALALFITQTGLGIEPDITGWDYPGAPLLFWQILLATALSLLALTLLRRRGQAADRTLFLLLWGAAAILWLRAPLKPSHYALEPGPPNFEFTPYSDAALLLLNAEDLLLGEGFQLPAEKPLYNTALALFLVLGKHRYLPTVNLQVLILALFPALVYLIFAGLEQRLAGVITATALTLREVNALHLADRINVSHSKLMMTDLPMALGAAALTWLLLRWLQHPDDWRRSLLAGGMLGAAVLIRSQAIIFLPLALILLLAVHPRMGKSWLHSAGLFALSTLAVLLPWMIRNRLVTGVFGYAQPMQAIYLKSQYSFTPGAFDLTDAPLERRIEQGFGGALEFARQHPRYVTGFIGAHFLHNEMAALLSLPMRLDLSAALLTDDYTPRAYVDSLPYWDVKPRWRGEWSPATLLLLTGNLLLLGIGLGTAWRHARWIGLTPWTLHLAYSLSSALARVSGSRFILPVDWILIGYYILGWATILRGLGLVREQERPGGSPPLQAQDAPRGVVLAAALGAWLLFGALSPLAEAVIPERYPLITLEAAREQFFQQSACSAPSRQASDVVLQGRALFPRFYKAADGYGRGPWAAYNYFPFPRLGFLLAGPQNANVLLPMDAPPETFPQAADAVVIGRQEDGYILAEAVLLRRDGQTWTYITANCQP